MREINNLILNQASKLNYSVSDLAPSTFRDLKETGLVIWSGESDNTIFDDPSVNHAFRALHDSMHLETGLDFIPEQEIELGRIQASKYDGFLADLFFIEVSKQAEYYLQNGMFIKDQKLFTLNELNKLGYKL